MQQRVSEEEGACEKNLKLGGGVGKESLLVCSVCWVERCRRTMIRGTRGKIYVGNFTINSHSDGVLVAGNYNFNRISPLLVPSTTYPVYTLLQDERKLELDKQESLRNHQSENGRERKNWLLSPTLYGYNNIIKDIEWF